MSRKAYPTELSNAEWAILAPLSPPAHKGDRPRTTQMPEVCNAIKPAEKTATTPVVTVFSIFSILDSGSPTQLRNSIEIPKTYKHKPC